MKKNERLKVFISYCSADAKIKDDVKIAIKGNGVFDFDIIDMKDLCADDYDEWMADSIPQADILVVILTDNILSPDQIGRKRVIEEIALAKDENVRIIPFVLANKKYDKVVSSHVRRKSAVMINDHPSESTYHKAIEEVSHKVTLLADRIIRGIDPDTIIIDNDSFIEPDSFIGREEELKQIESVFNHSNFVILKGMGGMGKTALAKMFCYKHKRRYTHHYIIPANEGIKKAICAIKFDQTEHLDEETRYIENVHILKKLSKSCFFIFDNCDINIDDDELAVFDEDIDCNFAITSRPGNSNDKIIKECTVNIKPMTNEDLKALVNKICKKNGVNVNDIADNPKDIDQLIKVTGGHTLAVELAISVCCKAGITIDEVIKNMLKDKNEVVTAHSNKNEETIYQQLTSLYNLAKLSEEEKKVMCAMSLVAPSGSIKLSILRKAVNLDSANAINKLANATFIRKEGFQLSLHPLISEIAYTYLLDSEVPKQYLEVVNKIVQPESVNHHDSNQLRYLITLILFIVNERKEYFDKHVPPFLQSVAYYRLADYYDSLNLYEDGLSYCIDAYKIYTEKVLKTDEGRIAIDIYYFTSLAKLFGTLLLNTDQEEQAKDILKSGFDLAVAAQKEYHLEDEDIYHEIYHLYYYYGLVKFNSNTDFEAFNTLREGIKKHRKKINNPSSCFDIMYQIESRIGDMFLDIALTVEENDETLNHAEDAYQFALDELKLGNKDIYCDSYCDIYFNLGQVANLKNNRQDAIKYLSQSLMIGNKLYENAQEGKVLININNELGNSYGSLNKDKEALECYLRASKIAERLVIEGRYEKFTLGAIYKMIGEYYLESKIVEDKAKAYEYLNKAKDILLYVKNPEAKDFLEAIEEKIKAC